jgi:hypothetical protein
VKKYAAGFEVRVDDSAQRVDVEGWGFWDFDDARRFEARVQRETAALTGPIALRASFSGYVAQTRTVQELQARAFSRLASLKLKSGACFVPDPIARLQLRRMFESCGMGECVFFTDRTRFVQKMGWTAELKPEVGNEG